MRKVIISVYTTLDGIMSPVDWSFGFGGEARGKYARDLLFESDALLLGRETYEIFAEVWPTRTSADDGPGEAGFIDRINSMVKYVASTTLEAPLKWNSTLIEGDLAEAVAALKQESGKNILIYGAGPVAHTLFQHGLVDELQVWIHPVVAGQGIQLLNNATDIPALKLIDTTTFDSGVVIHTYAPK